MPGVHLPTYAKKSDDLPTYAQKLSNSNSKVQKHLLCSVRANSTFVVTSSQSQLVAFMTCSARIAALKHLSFVVEYKNFCWLMYAALHCCHVVGRTVRIV